MSNTFFVKPAMNPRQMKEYEALQAKSAEQDRIIRALLGEPVEDIPEETDGETNE